MSFSVPRRAARLFCRVLPLLACTLAPHATCRAQQPYVGRYDLYTGFSDLNTPGLNNINQTGFHLQAGINTRRWLGYGFDYSIQSGSTALTAGLATRALQQQLAAELPPGYNLYIPFSATTQTITAGGQFVSRHYRHVTLFARPVLTAFRISATPHPTDAIGTLIARQLVPQGTKVDWVGAYGAGGGVEFPITRHLGARAQFDAGWNHPFNDILGRGSFSYRYSVGPAFHFGRNILGRPHGS